MKQKLSNMAIMKKGFLIHKIDDILYYCIVQTPKKEKQYIHARFYSLRISKKRFGSGKKKILKSDIINIVPDLKNKIDYYLIKNQIPGEFNNKIKY